MPLKREHRCGASGQLPLTGRSTHGLSLPLQPLGSGSWLQVIWGPVALDHDGGILPFPGSLGAGGLIEQVIGQMLWLVFRPCLDFLVQPGSGDRSVSSAGLGPGQSDPLGTCARAP